MDQREDQQQQQQQQQDQHCLLLQLHKEEEQDGRCKEQIQKTSSVQVQGYPGNAASSGSLLSSSVGPSEPLPILGLAWTFQNGGDATPMQSPRVDSLLTHKRGRGRPTKEQQAQPKPHPTALSTGGVIKRARGRPRKEDQQSQPKHPPPPTPTASRRGIKVGCGTPMLAHPTSGENGINTRRPIVIEKLPAAWTWCSIDAASTGIKRPRGRPRMYRPSAPHTGDAASAVIKRGRGRPRKERPDAASSGIKRGRGRPRKDKPEARMRAETGYAFASTGIKRGGGHPELGMEMLAAAAMLAETGDDVVPTRTKGVVENPRSVDVVSMWMEGALENPNPKTDKPPAGDIMSMMMMKRGRGRPKKDQQSQAPTTPTALSTGGMKMWHGRPKKDQQSQPNPPLTPTVSRRGVKVGCGRPLIIEKPPAARWSVDAALSGIKRPRGRPRKEKPSVAMSVETGDATPAPETGDATPAPETGDATPAPETGDATPAPETGDATPAPKTGDATPAEAGDAVSAVIKRGRGRPRKERPHGVWVGIKRGPEARMCAEAGGATPAPETGCATAAAIKRGRGRPRKERPDAAWAGIKGGMCAEAGDATPAPEAGCATAAAIKRPRGRPRKERPDAKRGMCAEAGDATPARETGCATAAAIKRPRGRPRKERPDAAWAGIKRGCGRPRKEKPEARMCGETGGAGASMGFERWGGQREPGMDMLAAAAMLAESGDDTVATGGSKGAVEDPINPRMEKASSADDIVWMVMKRGPGPGFGSWLGDMAEASRGSKQQEQEEDEEGAETSSTRVEEEEEKAGCGLCSRECKSECSCHV